jgi:hypothetical protein
MLITASTGSEYLRNAFRVLDCFSARANISDASKNIQHNHAAYT